MLKISRNFVSKSLVTRNISTTLSKYAKEKKGDEKAPEEKKDAKPAKGAPEEVENKPIDAAKEEGEWLLREVSPEQYRAKVKKLIPFAKTQPGTKGFGLEGHVLKGVSMFTGEQDPVVKSKESYPSWVMDVWKKELNEQELLEKKTKGPLSEKEDKRLIKLIRKRKIKQQNMAYKQGEF